MPSPPSYALHGFLAAPSFPAAEPHLFFVASTSGAELAFFQAHILLEHEDLNVAVSVTEHLCLLKDLCPQLCLLLGTVPVSLYRHDHLIQSHSPQPQEPNTHWVGGRGSRPAVFL